MVGQAACLKRCGLFAQVSFWLVCLKNRVLGGPGLGGVYSIHQGRLFFHKATYDSSSEEMKRPDWQALARGVFEDTGSKNIQPTSFLNVPRNPIQLIQGLTILDAIALMWQSHLPLNRGTLSKSAVFRYQKNTHPKVAALVVPWTLTGLERLRVKRRQACEGLAFELEAGRF